MDDLEGKWGYSTCRERYLGSFDTREEAVEEARACEPDSGFFTAQYEAIPAPKLWADRVIEEITEEAYSEVGEAAASWLVDVPKEEKANLETRLNNALHDWLNDYGYQPRFACVKESTVMEHDPAEQPSPGASPTGREG